MNKFTKASIATGAGIVLLLGGAGTLAYWNDSAALTAGSTTITAGTLTVTAGEESSWTVASFNGTDWNAPATIADIGDFRMVPGDKVTFTTTADIVAEGDNLKARVSLDGGSLTGDLASLLVKEITVTGSNITATGTAGVYAVATGTTEATITVTLTWPNGTAAVDNAGKLDTASLAALNVQVEQVFS